MALRRPLLFCLFLTLAGCAGRGAPEAPPEDTETHLSDKTDLDLKAWLDKPRADLAKLADEHQAAVEGHLERLRNDPTSATLLPALRVPTQGAVFHRATYRPALGFSLPDYVKADADAAVARHLAAHGDHEAAAKLGGPKSEGKSYPVEWTRAVAFALLSAQYRLGSGDAQAAADLVLAHQQLNELLDDDAKKSALGAVLLPVGKRTLFLAARAWRDPKVNLTALAGDVDKALAAWGDCPAPRFPALGRDALAAAWGGPIKGNVAVATGEGRARVLDLLGTGLPGEGVMAVGAFLDAEGQLAEVQYAYRNGLDTLYPGPADLAFVLEERGLAAGKEEKTAGLHRQPFAGPDVTVDVVRTNRSADVGAFVRVAPAKALTPAAGGHDPRDFGPAHLDRTFESCRLMLDPRLSGSPLTVSDKPALDKIAAGLHAPPPVAALLERDGDLVGGVGLSWANDASSDEATALLAALWSSFGCPAVSELADPAASALVLTWKDEKTRVEFRLPFDGKLKLLTAADAQPKFKQAARLHAAEQRDRRERDARAAAGKADERLATGPGKVNDFPLPGLKLGAAKEQVEEALPKGKDYRRKALPDGVSVLIDTPAEKAAVWAKQLLVRYAGGKVAEIRVRYVEGEAATHLKRLTADPKVGPGEEVAAEWAELWADLPGAKVTKTRWRDDRTERTYQRDAGGSEVTWRDRSAAAAPWRFVSPGPGAFGVGAAKEQFIAAYGAPATTSGEATVFRQPAKSPYEMVMVWFDGDKASRVVGVHRAKPAGDGVEQVNAALMGAWARDLGGLGFIRRQESRRADLLGGLYWHDDAVRVHGFVQESDGGPRQLTEWRAWPFPVRTPVAGN